MKLFEEYLIKAFDYEKENNKVCFLGDKSVFEMSLRQKMLEIEEKTKNRDGMILNIAVNYGGRDELVTAVKAIAEKVKAGEIQPCDITEQLISDSIYTKGQPDPDFILRPSGEKRLSNFMIWQASYSEFVFMDVLWPDFKRADLDKAIEEYYTRKRRFGGL